MYEVISSEVLLKTLRLIFVLLIIKWLSIGNVKNGKQRFDSHEFSLQGDENSLT